MKILRMFLIGLAALSLCSTAIGEAAAESRHQLSILAQPMSDALNALAAQTGMQIVFNVEDAMPAELSAPSVVGKFTAREALDRVLAKTDLKYEFVNKRTVRILPVQSAAATVESGLWEDARRVSQNSTLPSEQEMEVAQGAGQDDQVSSEPPESEGKAQSVQEIVVTAQKRIERLQDVPILMTVLSGKKLDSSTTSGVTEALRRVPGVVVSEALQGGGTQLTIRGVTAQGPLYTGAGPVAYYVDSAPFGMIRSAVAPDPNAYDLERVEVLRGPQGTLYGAGGMGGVVRVLTHDANLDEFEFKARTSVSGTEGGASSYRGDISVNAPIVDGRLAVRATLGYNDLGGWIDAPNHEDVNDAQLSNVRLRLRAQPTQNLSIGLSTWTSQNEYGAPSSSDDDGNITIENPQPISTDLSQHSLTIAYEFPGFTLSSNTSYLDYTNNGIIYFPGCCAFQTLLESQSFSQELLLSSTGDGPWQWSLGTFYRDAEDRIYNTLEPILPLLNDIEDRAESYAVFGEISRSFDNDLKLTAGLRYFNEEGETEGVIPPDVFAPRTASSEAITPRLVLAWTPSDALSMYASYSEGFRAGFVQSPYITQLAPSFPQVDPDRLHNYEIGAKGGLFNGRVSLEGALYYIDWEDIQLVVGVPVPGTPDLKVGATVNGEGASGLGADLSVAVHVSDNWEVGATFGWNDLTVDADVFDAGVGANLFDRGDRLPHSPEYTAGFYTDYSFPLVGDIVGRISASVNYTSETLIPNAGVPTWISDELVVGRASFALEGPDHWTAMLFADNVGNEDGVVDPSGNPANERSARLRPRTFGVQFEYRF